MRKFLFTVLILVGLVLGVTPGILGFFLVKMHPEMVRPAIRGPVEIQQYLLKRSWFSSKLTLELAVVDSQLKTALKQFGDLSEDPIITYQETIRHGVQDWFSGLTLFSGEGQLQGIGGEPLQVSWHVQAVQRAEVVISANQFSGTLSNGAELISEAPEGRFSWSKDRGPRFALQADNLRILGEDSSSSVQDVFLTADRIWDVHLKARSVTLPGFALQGPVNGQFQWLQGALLVTLKSPKTISLMGEGGPLELHLTANPLTYAMANGAVKTWREQQDAAAALLPLARQGANIQLAPLFWESPAGIVELTANANFNADQYRPGQSATALVEQADMRFRAPERLVQAILKSRYQKAEPPVDDPEIAARDRIHQLLANLVVVRDGEALVSDASLARQNLTVNGLPMRLPE